VGNYDRKAHRRVGAPLWEIAAERPQAVRSVVLGEVPDGYRETADTLDTQRVGATLAVDVVIGREHGVLFDARRMRDGRVLNSEAEVVSENEFRDDFGCPR
jgi:hypothetical protein